MMTLLGALASPFVRKVRVLLMETGQDDIAMQEVATTPVATAPEVAAANPVGKIPALIRDDGPTLYDSRVICRFLDARARAGFYPEARLWDTLTLEATAEGIMSSGPCRWLIQRASSASSARVTLAHCASSHGW